jgi:hypothetical protein
MRNLPEALAAEQERVRGILKIYHEIGPAGRLGAALIERALTEAEAAAASGDPLLMIQSYYSLVEVKE